MMKVRSALAALRYSPVASGCEGGGTKRIESKKKDRGREEKAG
jgi:hypothetical protein